MTSAMVPAAALPLVEDLLARCSFRSDTRPLDCAVSGGADSTALLILAVVAGRTVTAHHVDHGLRPGSADEAEIVADTAARFGADFVAHKVEVALGPNLEARARAARYGALPDPIATGHTLDDRAETVLINLLRGAARTGQSPLSDRDRHPIVGLRRVETEALCSALGLEVVHDPTNDDPRFVRNRVRHELLPLVDDISNRDMAALLDRQADLLGDEDAFLDALAGGVDPTDAKAVAAAPVVLARRALRLYITSSWALPHPPSIESVDRALSVAKGTAKACDLEGGHRIHRTDQRLRLVFPRDSVLFS